MESLRSLRGLVDIYLPDFKYFDAELAKSCSAAADYPEIARAAILEMRAQVEDVFDADGIMRSGLLVRHLVLPKHTEDSKAILRWIRENLGEKTY